MIDGPGVTADTVAPGPLHPLSESNWRHDMAEKLEEYTVTINGIEHTMLLTEEDAKRYGDNAKKGSGTQTKKASAPANKSGS